MESLERGILVVAVDGAMGDAAILEKLDKVRGKEALAGYAALGISGIMPRAGLCRLRRPFLLMVA